MNAKLLLYGRALGLGHAEAEDVLQETFLALLKLEESPRQPEFYVLRAYRNKSFSLKRTVLRRFRREVKAESWFETDEVDDEGELIAQRELGKLPPTQREVIVLKIWQGCTFDEIGRLLGISPNTAAARYRYGLQKLKKEWKGSAMNELKQLEGRLGGWTPRRPSRRVEAEIFTSRPTERAVAAPWSDGLGVFGRLLGPVGAFALVTLVSLSPVVGRTDAGPGIATRLTLAEGRGATAYDQLYHHSVLNHCDYPIFGWTNLSHPGEGIALFADGQSSCSD